MADVSKQTASIGVLWAVVCVLGMLGWAIIEKQDQVHTRELGVMRSTMAERHNDYQNSQAAIMERLQQIADRLPPAKQ